MAVPATAQGLTVPRGRVRQDAPLPLFHPPGPGTGVLAAGRRHCAPVLTAPLCARFLWDDYVVEVRLNDYLDVICPHYEEGSTGAHAMERYTLYLVEREEFVTCKPHSKDQVRWECNKPTALHGPERFSEKFQRFTPFTLGKEFKEGHSYYYISKPIHHHGDTCLKLKVTVVGKASQTPPSPIPTERSGILADDPAQHVLRSVDQNAAMRRSSSVALLSLLLPLLVLPGL
ncbi:PREDICTED: ephrin-A1 [Crocodylus porosus]|uniref:ephrin-A1 n=1 Tax=Crocodylus porosus TaxID=8502 RepID=UPI00093AD89B|nr:PREDICTED: ephrin-A1 [Crocodylus porosus]